MFSDRYNVKDPIMSFPFTTDELVDNLFAVVQNIVAGTASHSVKILNKTCLQWKIEFSSMSPIILLHYEHKSDENERVEIVPVSDFKIMHENSGTEDGVNVNKQVNSRTLDDRRENSLTLYNIKQEIPELLLVLYSDQQSKDKNKDGNKTKSSSIIMNSDTESISSTVNSLSENLDSSSIMKLIHVTVSESKMKTLRTEEENGNDHDMSKSSEKLGNDNGISGKKGRPVKRKSVKEEQHKRNPRKVKPSISRKSEKFYICKICGKSFSTSSRLLIHMRIHTGEKPFKCNVCDRSFTTKGSLIRHERIHTGEKPFKCDICGKSFTRKNNLSVHNIIHTAEKPFKCEICDKSFNFSSSLIMHERIHTGEKPFKCEICGKSFPSSCNLTKHKRIHTGEKPFKCNICNRSFTQRVHLKRHERIHAG